MEALLDELQVLEGQAIWYSLHLEDAETNPQLASLFREADKKRDEGDTLSSKYKYKVYHVRT